MKKIFIDGAAGTTGLKIYDRIKKRADLELIILSEEKRKDIKARKEAINDSDAAFLCLPDDAARESVSLVENPNVVILDTSTAHRTAPEFAYGFPELGENFKKAIVLGKRIAVPGCYASGFIGLLKPLIDSKLLSKDAYINCFAVSGYSGAGKKGIAEYQNLERDILLDAPRQYAVGQMHKHLKEMAFYTQLNVTPIFCPFIADYYAGMEVTVPLFKKDVLGSVDDIKNLYRQKYNGKVVKFSDNASENGFYSASKLADNDGMIISVEGNEDRILLIARYDNLGKGASGAAVQCMNLALGFDETEGLVL